MVTIIGNYRSEIYEEVEDFVSAINLIEQNEGDFEPGEKIALIDFENKQTMFVKIKTKVEEY